MAKWLELYVLPIIRAQRCLNCNPPVKTHGAFNVIPEASMLLVMQAGNLALTYLTNEIAGIIAYERRITSSITYMASQFVNYF